MRQFETMKQIQAGADAFERHETLQGLEVAKLASGDTDTKGRGNYNLHLGHSQKTVG